MTEAQQVAARARAKAWREANPERAKAALRSWYSRNREAALAQQKEYRARQAPEKLRKQSRDKARRARGNYLSDSDYARLLAAQGGGCAVCGTTKCGRCKDQPLVVDHCHKTGRVRGLLCGKCNRALGALGDDADALGRALRYVEGQ